MRNFFPKSITVGVLALAIGALTWAAMLHRSVLAQTPPPVTETTRTVSVTGNGIASVRPDVAVVTVGVQTEATEASAALNQNNEQMQAVLAALQATGVLSDDIQTQTVQLQPQIPVPPLDQPQPLAQTGASAAITPTGYIASNLVEVRVRDLTALGGLLDSVTTAGGNRIQGIRFEVSDPQAALAQARQRAWDNARSSAEGLAQLAGVTLGSVMQIREYSSAPIAPAPAGDVRLAEASIPISPGAQQVTVSLEIAWQLGE